MTSPNNKPLIVLGVLLLASLGGNVGQMVSAPETQPIVSAVTGVDAAAISQATECGKLLRENGESAIEAGKALIDAARDH